MFISLLSYKLTLLVQGKTYLDMTNYLQAPLISSLKKYNRSTKVQV